MKVLFVCQGNAGRSVAAEYFYNRLSKNMAESAGTIPKAEHKAGLPPGENVVRCMRSGFGIDISSSRRTQLTKRMVDGADRIVVMLEKRQYKTMPAYLAGSKKAVFWDTDDMYGVSDLKTRRVLKQIQGKVKKLVRETG